MKKKIIICWMFFFVIAIGIIPISFLIREIFNPSKYNSIIIFMLSVIIVLGIVPLNESFSFTKLTEIEIAFKYKFTGKIVKFPVGKINKLVVDFDCISSKRDIHLIIYANSKKGAILGVGNAALMALMKYYPHLPVVLKDIYWMMSRSVAKYIVKHQKTSKFKCKQLCEYYHLSKKLLEYTTDSNDGENSDVE